MQAQDYAGVLWAVGLRSAGATSATIEDAIAKRQIIRTWPLRGTLHLVAPEDVRWMLALASPRAIALATARHNQLGLTEKVFANARALFVKALKGGRMLTRAEAMALLESGEIATGGQRGYHILWMLAQQAVLCIGPMQGKQQTFVLFDEWVPKTGEAPLEPKEALARLAERYFQAHGPATLEDFKWWAGITKNEARIGLEAVSESLERIESDNEVYYLPPGDSAARRSSRPTIHLLPGFDEYMLGYTDRSLQLGDHREYHGSIVSANGMFSPTLLVDGQITGTWKRTFEKDQVEVGLRTFRALETAEREVLAKVVDQYGRFLGKTAVLRNWGGAQIR